MSACPDCDETTITTPDGRHLQPRRTIVGRHLPDGTDITTEALRAGARGHLPHECQPKAPAPKSEQHSLF